MVDINEAFVGPRIIDNSEIVQGGRIVDIVADPAQVRSYLLDRSQAARPQFVDRAISRINGLTISFGSRPIAELEKEIKAVWTANGQKDLPEDLDTEVKCTIFPLAPPICYEEARVESTGYVQSSRPYIIINTGIIREDARFTEVVAHQFAHFIDILDPQNESRRRDNIRFFVNLTGLEVPMLALLLASQKLSENAETSRRKFLADFIGAGAIIGGVGGGIPTAVWVSPNSRSRADEITKTYLSDGRLEELIVVKERGQIEVQE